MKLRPAAAAILHTPSLANPLPEDWDWYRLDEVCDGVFDCPHSTPVFATEGPYLARSQDIRGGVFRVEQAARVSEETYLDRVRRAEPVHGDLLYSREGTYFGIAAEVPPNIKVCLGQRMVLIRPKPGVANFRYLRFWLNSPILAGHVYGHRDGTVAERLNLPTIRGLPVPVAPIREQDAIGQILGTLDDKIDLNRRMNETLEAIARALFRSWFVDFDPVRAKQEGRHPPGLDAATAALFPDSFADSPLGLIPAGWSVKTFFDVAELISGGTPSTSEPAYWGGAIPWASAKDVSQCGDAFLTTTERSITKEGLSNSSTKIVPKFTTVVVARGATTGRFTMFGDDIAMNQTCYGLRSRDGHHFLFNCLFHNLVRELVHAAHGSVFDTITTATFERIQLAVPPKVIGEAFDILTKSVFQKILVNLHEAQTLAALRDALLPKLLSGEIRVQAGEPNLEAVT